MSTIAAMSSALRAKNFDRAGVPLAVGVGTAVPTLSAGFIVAASDPYSSVQGNPRCAGASTLQLRRRPAGASPKTTGSPVVSDFAFPGDSGLIVLRAMAVSTSLPRGWSTDDFAFVVDRLFPEFDDAPIEVIAFSIRDAAHAIPSSAGRLQLVARAREIIHEKLRAGNLGAPPTRVTC